MRIAKALIVADPWIGYILDGSKIWEMRSTAASHRGWFGLIRKGTGAVHGVARLVGVGAPLSPDEMIATFEHHRIPEAMIRSGEVAKWNTPWKLADVRRLDRPVPYRHRSGAVTWVDLDDEAIDTIARQIQGLAPARHELAPAAQPVDAVSPGRLDVVVDVSQRRRKIILDIKFKYAAPETALKPVRAGHARDAAVESAGKAEHISGAGAPFGTTIGMAGQRIGEIEINEANLTHSHFYLHAIFERFPADAVGGSNKASAARRMVTIDWGGPEPVVTDLDGKKKFFRVRGWVRSFFEMNDASAGDLVLVEQIAPYHYRVRFAKRLHESRPATAGGNR
jgi:hypothetical protein